jgi:hypothetical protein
MSMIAAFLLLASGTADAAAPTTPPAPQTDKSDPMVCETSEEIGSRLKKKRVCMRRSEWRAQHQEEAQMINRTQVQRGVEGGK